MKNIVLALVAALLIMFVYTSASADTDRNRYEGTIIADGTQCIDYITGEVFATYNTGDYVEILPKSPTDQSPDELVNTYSSANRLSCFVPDFAVEYLPDSRVYDDVTTDELPTSVPAVEIGTNIVNDYANCRVAPSLDAEVVTVLEPGRIVTELADGAVGDGWQWVGLEATDCHISVDLLGEKPTAATEAEPTQADDDHGTIVGDVTAVTEPIVADETVVAEPTPAPAPPVVTGLPSTGTGKIVASNILFWGIVPVGLVIAGLIARYCQSQGEKTMKVISR